MKSSFTAERNARDCCLEFRIVLDDADFANLELGDFDRAVLADCGGPDRTASDQLLALELIFRRLEEQSAKLKEHAR